MLTLAFYLFFFAIILYCTVLSNNNCDVTDSLKIIYDPDLKIYSERNRKYIYSKKCNLIIVVLQKIFHLIHQFIRAEDSELQSRRDSNNLPKFVSPVFHLPKIAFINTCKLTS